MTSKTLQAIYDEFYGGDPNHPDLIAAREEDEAERREALLFGPLTCAELECQRVRRLFSSNPQDLPASVRARMRDGVLK